MRELTNLKLYNNKNNGGVSPCRDGNRDKLPLDKRFNVLGNCVGWTVGRFNEFSGLDSCKWLESIDAKFLYNVGIKQGLSYGRTPRVGAMAVFENGSGNKGHVYNVERINKDGSIYVSESGWNGSVYYWHATHRPPNYNTGEGWLSSYNLVGFIYQPLIKVMYNNAEIGLNVRSEPSTSSAILSCIPYKEKVNVYSIEGNWAATEIGWCYMDYLQDEPIKEIKEELPLVEDIIKEIEQIPEGKTDSIVEIPQYYENKEKENALLWLLQSILSFLKKIFNIK